MTSRSRHPQKSQQPTRRKPLIVAACLALVAAGAGGVIADWWHTIPVEEPATFVGRSSCIQCHTEQARLWEGSHHDLAMDRATPETVLADFADAELEHHGITSRMFRRDGKFMVRTEGPDGNYADFEVKYVFGVEPLQQYMVEFDRPADMPDHEIARLQVLRLSWDTQRKQWFHLDPPDVSDKLEPNDDLHWTGIAQRWNTMCADCHSTNLQKNFDPHTKTYHTTFSEIDVSCEACHGPGSTHVKLANSRSLFWDRKLGYGLAELKGDDTEPEIHACAPCHSRRRVVAPNYRPGENYYDYFVNELLEGQSYHADGQILDEVYVYGSFIQSKMYHKSIRCTDCHDPHSARLIHTGNQVCTSCHQHSAGKYDHPTHHFHNVGSSGAACVSCHMPSTTYMEVDPRRDHSLRVPRPDLSVDLATPNACTGCHLDRAPLSAERRESLPEYADWLRAAREGDAEVRDALAAVDAWAAAAVEDWYGPPARQERPQRHFAHALQLARERSEQAADALLELARDTRATPIVRATSLQELSRMATPAVALQASELLNAEDPQIRIAALQLLQVLPDDQLAELAVPLLKDTVRSVRTEAGRILARVPRAMLRGPQRQDRRRAIAEFRQGVLLNSDRAAAHMGLGILYEALQDLPSARAAYRTAISVQPGATGPRTNLAAVYDQLVRELAQQTGAVRAGEAAEVYEKLAHYQQEAQRLRREELELLQRDAGLAPDNAAIQYRLGLSLYLQNRLDEAEQALARAAELEPQTPDFVLGLALLYQKLGRFNEALSLAERLVELRPDDQQFELLYRQIQLEARAPGTRE